MSSVVGSGTQGSPDVKQLITRTIGPQPIIQDTIGEVTVDCLVDSGSQGSMIEDCFFKQHPRAKNLTDDGKERKERIVDKVLFKDMQTMLIMLFYQAVDSGSQVSMIEDCFFKQHPRAKNLTDDGKERKERIVDKVLFKDMQIMLIMLFYQAVLPLIKNYVVRFHSNVPLFHELHDRPEQLFLDFWSCFIKQEELVDKSATQLKNLSLTDDLSLSKKDVFIGGKASGWGNQSDLLSCFMIVLVTKIVSMKQGNNCSLRKDERLTVYLLHKLHSFGTPTCQPTRPVTVRPR